MSPHSTMDNTDTYSEGNYSDAAAPVTNGLASGGANGVTNGLHKNTSRIQPAAADSLYDLVCVGFGPASLAVAVAINDALEAGTLAQSPKILFLEKQSQFAWHAGMLLPGAKMQISFIKDMASLRNPRSNFTFLNYLHQNDRLVEFTNLSTFLPARVEYEDYLRWCASHFDDVVRYDSEVLSVSRDEQAEDGAVRTFRVASRDARTGEVATYRGRNVLMAIGGQAKLPPCLPAGHPKVVHSSQYAQLIPKILDDANAPYRVAVVGAGQSAAEIFNNIHNLYPNSRTWLVMRSEFLKPSDDSPFVNSIFNPEYVDMLYPKSEKYRQNFIVDARATNYGVVRLELIEKLYERLYDQRRDLGRDEKRWPHRILGGRRIAATTTEPADGKGTALRLKVEHAPVVGGVEVGDAVVEAETETLDVDLVIAATGYRRDAHVDMLQDVWGLLPETTSEEAAAPRVDRWLVQAKASKSGAGENAAAAPAMRVMEVGRDYGVKFTPGSVAEGSGVWLQGCCEGSHGLSDTLLSVLATRAGEIVESIFGVKA
ncbi:uncharacterized protein E0L32_005892 [Thyridium curvatum]|uniref:L-ornithine N(5)-monooxygenase [NAD(P)H] n=1 Tax=Thyridium curvatum TaxID=1093900 RepID=A0A507B8H8_9PEZI|nr:uncharacterized protein E0L32_005892 [Thyridium curvatum]TPX13689.1 hypothetical protein E0L32_005892 [Thyridium curvatum]